jgi:hypothetical protein
MRRRRKRRRKLTRCQHNFKRVKQLKFPNPVKIVLKKQALDHEEKEGGEEERPRANDPCINPDQECFCFAFVLCCCFCALFLNSVFRTMPMTRTATMRTATTMTMTTTTRRVK